MGKLGFQEQSNRAAEPSPILDLKNPSRSQRLGKIIVRGIKCKCGKSWCRVCSVKTVKKRFYEYVQGWDWQRVRELVLTVDRDKFDSPEQAYTYLSKKKKIAGMIRNLERTQGIVVADWCWLVEWHTDACFNEVRSTGRIDRQKSNGHGGEPFGQQTRISSFINR